MLMYCRKMFTLGEKEVRIVNGELTDYSTTIVLRNNRPLILPSDSFLMEDIEVRVTRFGSSKKEIRTKITILREDILALLEKSQEQASEFVAPGTSYNHLPKIGNCIFMECKKIPSEKNERLILKLLATPGITKLIPCKMDISTYLEKMLLVKELPLITDVQSEVLCRLLPFFWI